jgi:lipid-A-disaccharide synthase-like uncharacterized protein
LAATAAICLSLNCRFGLILLKMDRMTDLLWHGGNFLGIEWNEWKVIGWAGNAIFFSRFFVQWYATEKKKQVVVPTVFWWLSLAGSFLLLLYALCYRKDSVFIFAYAFTWIPYIRNIVIHGRHKQAQVTCPACGRGSPPSANYCATCGLKLPLIATKESR